ncbi:hypothetical protein EVAR_73104_1, partial [Eumeta japonica]
VLSGDTVVIRALKALHHQRNKSPFRMFLLKLARRPGAGGDETKDEPYAWESREFYVRNYRPPEPHKQEELQKLIDLEDQAKMLAVANGPMLTQLITFMPN